MSDDECKGTKSGSGEPSPATRTITFGKARFASVEDPVRRARCAKDEP